MSPVKPLGLVILDYTQPKVVSLGRGTKGFSEKTDLNNRVQKTKTAKTQQKYKNQILEFKGTITEKYYIAGIRQCVPLSDCLLSLNNMDL